MDVPENFTSLPQAADPIQPTHPKGSKARVLLASVFGPYAVDDEYSRKLNPMELYQNQVTRAQGPFSLRMFHRSWGIMLIQANIDAPTTVLDFPKLDRFIEEIRENEYDVIGITAITPNLMKVKKMCALIREYQPNAKIVVGGHIANISDLADRVGCDHTVKGDGVGWFQRYLGEDESRPTRHPLIVSGFGTRNVGMTLRPGPSDTAAALIPSVGCPMGCNFCSTSAMFGGKGKCHHFYKSGDELFDVMCQLEEKMGVCSFFTMDENFLFHRKRALRILELMKQHDKSWALYVFSSARVLRSYTTEELVGLGVSWVWMGLEGEDSQYTKLHGIDTRELIRDMQSHGIRVLGSTIIGLENHTPDNLDDAIDFAVAHDTDFHQFMLYTPIPGTPLHAQLTADGRMKDEPDEKLFDIHGQDIFNYRHAHIAEGDETEMILRAFTRDFEVNGPSVVRVVRSTLLGWKRYKNHPDARIRRRYEWEARELAGTYSALVGATRLYYRDNPPMFAKMDRLVRDLNAEFGLKSKFFSTVGARLLLWKIRREEKRLAAGWTYEPPTFYEKNFGQKAGGKVDASGATSCEAVVSRVAPKPKLESDRNIPEPDVGLGPVEEPQEETVAAAS